MKHSRPSNVSSEMDPEPQATPDVESALRMRPGVGIHGFVVSAYEAHHGEVYSFLARATRDRAAAEDLLHATFVRLTKEAREGHAPVEVRAWLYRVATDLVIGRGRRKATALRWLGRFGPQTTRAPRRDEDEDIERALEGLSADARLALLLSGSGFSGEEIGAAIDRSPAATRTLLWRARARVRIRRDLFAERAR